jgi:catechol 2,3-dioxygenase-like lactoylglutathione lyase family enzyme
MAIDYIMIGISDLARSRRFYDAVFGRFGGAIAHDYSPHTVCYRFRNGTRAWIARPQNKADPEPGNGNMPGFLCASETEVDAAHTAALANGGSDEGAPGPRPIYGPEFYGGYVRDPDGNKMGFIFNRPVAA